MRFFLMFLLPFAAYAKDNAVGNNFLYTFDTDGNQIIQDTISGWFKSQQKPAKPDLGIGYTHTWYINEQDGINYNYSGSAISLITDFTYNDFSIIGTGGIAQSNNRNSPYFLGDLNFNYQYNKNTTLSIGTYGDIVNSTKAMHEGIVFTGYSLTVDYYNDIGGIAGNVGQMIFSDNNVRTIGNLKIYADVMDGLNLYLKTKQYGDSQPNNDIYWSPEMYSRYSIGAGFRQRYFDMLFSGFIELGAAYTNQEWAPVTAWRLNIEPKITSNWTGNLAIGSDINQNDNYKWFYVNANIKYDF